MVRAVDPQSSAEAQSSEAALVAGIRRRDEGAVRELTRRYNQRLFRIARSILRRDDQAEDAVQDAYVRAFTRLDDFRGESAFGTWLTRILINEALGRARRPRVEVAFTPEAEPALRPNILAYPAASHRPDPESAMSHLELRAALEHSIDALPDDFRHVFVARLVEGLSVEETSALFGIRPETVKTRLHRARARLRRDLSARLGTAAAEAFAFDGARCDRLSHRVLARVRDAWRDTREP
jgi:RNA polymerase sigma-70 factor (ECF subfamily)